MTPQRHLTPRAIPNLRVICPIRAGYGHSDALELTADPLDAASQDSAFLLNTLGVRRLPYVAQGPKSNILFACSFGRADNHSVVLSLDFIKIIANHRKKILIRGQDKPVGIEFGHGEQMRITFVAPKVYLGKAPPKANSEADEYQK